jgi:hypothetical protein
MALSVVTLPEYHTTEIAGRVVIHEDTYGHVLLIVNTDQARELSVVYGALSAGAIKPHVTWTVLRGREARLTVVALSRHAEIVHAVVTFQYCVALLDIGSSLILLLTGEQATELRALSPESESA